MNILKLILSVCLCIAVGCAPRGESKSLDQVLASAKQRFLGQSNVKLAAATDTQLQTVSKNIEMTLNSSSQELQQSLASLSTDLAALINKAGYTTRPALNELMLQYQKLGSSDSKTVTEGQVKLLAARTYSLLASELETTAFGIS